MRFSYLLIGVLIGSGCGSIQPVAAPQHIVQEGRGHLFIVGGGPRPAELMQHFVELAGGPGRARIAVVPTGSATPSETGESLVRELERLGAQAFSMNLTREQAEDPTSAHALDGVTGVWFSGGVQTRHTDTFRGTPIEAAFHRLYRDGAVLGGTSAGAAIMSPMMITGEERRPGGDRPVQDDSWITIDRDNVVTTEGFGFLRGAIVDQHFVRRKRHNRLLSLVLEHPDQIGVGVEEATALVVRPDGTWTVLGQSVVVIYDARAASVTTPDAPALGGVGVRMHILPEGAVFNPATGEATISTRGARAFLPTGTRFGPALQNTLIAARESNPQLAPRASPAEAAW